MKTRLKNDIIDVLEYFEHGLADVQEGSDEEQPKLKEIRSILRRLKANGAEQSTSNCNIPLVSVSLPNDIDLGALVNLLKYSNKYEISIQFCPDQIAVYIAKDGVDLKDFGGDFDFAIGCSVAYLNRITGNER